MNRTQDEILARIDEIEADDMFGWSRELLISYLDFEHAKAFLRDGVTPDQWEPRTDPRADLVAYLDFAWEKANGERGISANRSVDKITHWLWLTGDDGLLAQFKAARYEPYGKPQLAVVTEALAPDLLAVVR